MKVKKAIIFLSGAPINLDDLDIEYLRTKKKRKWSAKSPYKNEQLFCYGLAYEK